MMVDAAITYNELHMVALQKLTRVLPSMLYLKKFCVQDQQGAHLSYLTGMLINNFNCIITFVLTRTHTVLSVFPTPHM